MWKNAKYIYIYIFVLFSSVKPEIKPFNYEHLNLPGKELNVTDITEQ